MNSASATAALEPTTPRAERIDALRSVAALDGLADQEYEWLASHSVEQRKEAGAVLFREGDPVREMVILLHGEINVRPEHGGPTALFTGRAGQITGLLPFSRMKAYGATGYTSAESWALTVDRDLFPAMLQAIPSMAQRCVSILLDRVREVTRIEQQSEKLTALGKLAGNLAHELNNPASAAQRSASGLLSELSTFGRERFRLGAFCFDPQQIQNLRQWEQQARASTQILGHPSPALLAAREDLLNAWVSQHSQSAGEGSTEPFLVSLERQQLERQQLEEQPDARRGTPYPLRRLIPELAEVGLTPEHLESLPSFLTPEAVEVVLSQFASSVRAERLAGAMLDSTARIFDLIRAIKDYSYMDQAPIQDIDIAQSLENTLAMLGSRLSGIAVERCYGTGIPAIPAYGSELNQVWTELLENALDALAPGVAEAARSSSGPASPARAAQPRLRISAAEQGEFLLVEVEDNGPGIPADLQPRVFEPFFTTKAPGQGLGLGLDTAMRIVRMHRGLFTVDSQPGRTCFQVRIPLKPMEAY